jgi:nucleoside-diphosphate-sugar epimerase
VITEIDGGIFTGAYIDLATSKHEFNHYQVVDVRDLVDKAGNDIRNILTYAQQAREKLKTHGKVIIVCDMGISRSRIVAITLLSLLHGSVEEALDLVRERCGNPPINLELIQEIRRHFNEENSSVLDSRSRIVIGSKGFVGSQICDFLESIGGHPIGIHRGNQSLDDTIGLIRTFESSSATDVIYAINHKSFHSDLAFSESLRTLKNVLEACRHTRKRLVYLSGMVVFAGNAKNSNQADYFASEDMSPSPWGNYSDTKYFSEELIRTYGRSYGVEHLIIRPSALYGLGMRPQWMVNRFIQKALRNQDISTHEYFNTRPCFEFLHMTDFLSALSLTLECDRDCLRNVSINIGSGCLTSTFDLADRIISLSDSSSKLGLQPIEDRIHNVCTVPGFIRSLGWTPSVGLDEGLQACIDELARQEQ